MVSFHRNRGIVEPDSAYYGIGVRRNRLTLCTHSAPIAHSCRCRCAWISWDTDTTVISFLCLCPRGSSCNLLVFPASYSAIARSPFSQGRAETLGEAYPLLNGEGWYNLRFAGKPVDFRHTNPLYSACSTRSVSMLNLSGLYAQFARSRCTFWLGVFR